MTEPRVWQLPEPPDCTVRDSHGTVWRPTGHRDEWVSEYRLCTSWATLLTDRGPLTEETS
jgi:hypothetical protein